MTDITPVNPIQGRIVYEQILKVQRALVRDRKIHVFEVLLAEDLMKPFLRHVGVLPGEWNAALSSMIGDNGAYLKVTQCPFVLVESDDMVFCTPVGKLGFPVETSTINQRLSEIDLMVSGLIPYETIEEPEAPAALDGDPAAEPDAPESTESGEGAAQAPIVVQGSGLPTGGTDAAAESVSGGAPVAKTVSKSGAQSTEEESVNHGSSSAT